MIGDTETDIEAGLLAGATSVLFDPRGRKTDTAAHHTIKDLREILRL
jgi:phosphoglycolate phosphatase-like HAD superfamily hydrolase